MGNKAPKNRKAGRPPTPHAEHRRVAAELRTQLLAGAWRAGEVLPSLRQLAEQTNSSLNVIRRSVALLRAEKRLALNARKRLVAVKNSDPAMDGRGVVLVVSADPLPGPWSWYNTALISGILQGAGDIGAPVLLVNGVAFRHTMPAGFLDYPLRGIVLVGHFRPSVLREYERLPVPVVIADTPANESKIHSVCVDNAAAMKETVRRLVELGHRRIAFMRFILFSMQDVDPDSRERHAGYLEACREAGLPVKSDWVFNVLPDFNPEKLENFRRLVGPGSKFTAIITGQPDQVQRTAESLGREVPRQLSIATVSAQGMRTYYSGPAVDFMALGRQAAPLLNQPKHPPIRIRIPTGWHDAGTVQKPEFPPEKP